MTPLLRFCFWPVFFVTHFLAIALLAWHLLAQTHFAYPLGYQLLGLESHIAEYAPLNRYKKGFEDVSKEEHWRLFGEISDAVQNSGKGLENITYALNNGQRNTLLHKAEIIHLQDVANLIDFLYLVGISCGIIWLCLLVAAWRFKWIPPTLFKVSLGFIGALLVISLIVLGIGAKDVFYWLHVQIFPDDHQWFFYYQDSLMTTLMKAPDIFAFITLVLLVLLIGLWGLSYWVMSKFLLSATEKSSSPQKTGQRSTRQKRKY